MMWRATIRKGSPTPYVCQCRDHELYFDEQGVARRIPVRPFAKMLANGDATAVSQSREGAVASVLCVVEEDRRERALLGKRDRT